MFVEAILRLQLLHHHKTTINAAEPFFLWSKWTFWKEVGVYWSHVILNYNANAFLVPGFVTKMFLKAINVAIV